MKTSQNGGDGAVILARTLPLSFELDVAVNPVVTQDLFICFCVVTRGSFHCSKQWKLKKSSRDTDYW